MTARRDQMTRKPETSVNISILPVAGDQTASISEIEDLRERRRAEKREQRRSEDIRWTEYRAQVNRGK